MASASEIVEYSFLPMQEEKDQQDAARSGGTRSSGKISNTYFKDKTQTEFGEKSQALLKTELKTVARQMVCIFIVLGLQAFVGSFYYVFQDDLTPSSLDTYVFVSCFVVNIVVLSFVFLVIYLRLHSSSVSGEKFHLFSVVKTVDQRSTLALLCFFHWVTLWCVGTILFGLLAMNAVSNRLESQQSKAQVYRSFTTLVGPVSLILHWSVFARTRSLRRIK